MNRLGRMIRSALFAYSVSAACFGQVLARDSGVVPSAAVAIGSYYTEALQEDCYFPPATQCRLTFSAVPSGKTLLITLVTCDLYLTGGDVTLATVKLLARTNTSIIGSRVQFLAPQFTASTSTYNQYEMTVQTSFLVLPGQHPLIEVDAFKPGDIFAACSITGQRPSPL
jgi:hypothetical protein